MVSNSKFKDEAKIIDHCPYIYVEKVLDQKSVNLLRRATGLDCGESEAIIMADEVEESLIKLKECGIRMSDSLYNLVLNHIGL